MASTATDIAATSTAAPTAPAAPRPRGAVGAPRTAGALPSALPGPVPPPPPPPPPPAPPTGPATRTAAATSRVWQLDVLRGVAILLVLGRHMDGVPLRAPALVQDALYAWRDIGWVGVDLFFVLSGFLVSGLLFREYQRRGDVRIGRFLARRGLKIYPAFYAFLIATTLVTGTLHTRGFLAEALFVQNYVPGLWDHTWSLAVEEHFYLLLAGLVFFLTGRQRRQRGASAATDDPFAVLVPVFAVVAVAELGLRIAAARYASPWYTHHLAPTHLRLDSLLFGVLLSYLAHYHTAALAATVRARRALLFVASALCLAPVFYLPVINVFMETVGFTLVYLGFGGLLLLTLYGSQGGQTPSSERRATPALAAVAWIGVYSYSIYLWHLAVKRWLMPSVVQAMQWSPGSLAAFLGYLVAAILVGTLMARLVEWPGLMLRERWLGE